jgi:subtilisin family serine protease
VAPQSQYEMQNYGVRYVLQSGYSLGEFSRNVVWDAGITGANQVVGVGDTGVDRRSCFLSGAGKFVMMRSSYDMTTADESGHGTHVCASMAGESEGGSDLDGVAKQAKIAFTDLMSADGNMRITGSGLGDDYFAFSYAAGARVHSDSWGRIDQGYSQLTFEVDEYIHRKQDFVSVFAAGNYGDCSESYCGGTSSYANPSNAKNVVAVGASKSYNSPASTLRERPTWHVDLVGDGAEHWKHVLFRAVEGAFTSVGSFIVEESFAHVHPDEACGGTLGGNFLVFLTRRCC